MTRPAHPTIAPPVGCDRLEAIVARSAGSFQLRDDETHASYALPTSASAELREFLRAQALVKFEPAFVAHLPGGRVFGSGNVLSADGTTIARDVSPDFGKPFEEHWLRTYKKIRPPVSVPGATAVIATTLGVGYSHWLLEELPRLLALKPGDCEALIAHAGNAFNLEAFALGGFSGRIIEAKREAHFSCGQLIVPSLGRLTPATVQALEEFTALLLRHGGGLGERLYISREKARRRRLANETELWTQLESRGFVKLHLEDLTWAQQINAFRAAKIVIAPHGAGLANLAFCEAGTKVIELFNRSYVNPCFWQLAALKGLDYCPLVQSATAVEPLAQTLSGNRLDITANVAQVLAALGDPAASAAGHSEM